VAGGAGSPIYGENLRARGVDTREGERATIVQEQKSCRDQILGTNDDVVSESPPAIRRGFAVVELPAGALDRADTQPGDRLHLADIWKDWLRPNRSTAPNQKTSVESRSAPAGLRPLDAKHSGLQRSGGVSAVRHPRCSIGGRCNGNEETRGSD
jgi:hypothetical protein